MKSKLFVVKALIAASVLLASSGVWAQTLIEYTQFVGGGYLIPAPMPIYLKVIPDPNYTKAVNVTGSVQSQAFNSSTNYSVPNNSTNVNIGNFQIQGDNILLSIASPALGTTCLPEFNMPATGGPFGVLCLTVNMKKVPLLNQYTYSCGAANWVAYSGPGQTCP